MTHEERLAALERHLGELARAYEQIVKQNGLMTQALIAFDAKLTLMEERLRLQQHLDTLTPPPPEKPSRPNLTVIEGDQP